MPKQDRAIRTRQAILLAAADVFQGSGYQAATINDVLTAAGVTKGALYFHFKSKEDLAQGDLNEQARTTTVPPRPSKVQELIDVVMLHAYRLQTDPMVRASVRLSMDQHAQGLDRTGPFITWANLATNLLQQAKNQGELLPQITPTTTADVIVGSFAGIQSMSHALNNYQHLMTHTTHLLPSITPPSLLATLDFTPTRGTTIHNELHPTPTPTPTPTDDTH